MTARSAKPKRLVRLGARLSLLCLCCLFTATACSPPTGGGSVHPSTRSLPKGGIALGGKAPSFEDFARRKDGVSTNRWPVSIRSQIIVFLDRSQRAWLEPMLNELGKECKHSVIVAISCGWGNQPPATPQDDQTYESAPDTGNVLTFTDEDGTAAASFLVGQVPSLFVVDCKQTVAYKLMGFRVSQWKDIFIVAKSVDRGAGVPQEYSLLDVSPGRPLSISVLFEDLPLEVPVWSTGRDSSPHRAFLVLLTGPYPLLPGSEDRMAFTFFSRFVRQHRDEGIRGVLVVKGTQAVEAQACAEFSTRFGVPVTCGRQRASRILETLFGRAPSSKEFMTVRDLSGAVFRRCGFPATPFLLLIARDGIVLDARCAICDDPKAIEEYYERLLKTGPEGKGDGVR